MAGVPYNPNGGSASSQAEAIRRRSSGGGGGGGGVGGGGKRGKRSGTARAKTGATRAPGTDWDAFIADLLGQYGTGGGGGGGGGYGGGGGGGNGAAIAAALEAARMEYEGTNNKLKDLYGDLAKTYEPLAGQTKQRYDQAILAAQQGSARIQGENAQRSAREQQAANAAAAEMGIASGPVASQPATQQQVETNYTNSQLQLQGGDWSGLMATGREAQIGRDKANLQGARDAGVIAQEELRKQYEAYIEQLKAQAYSGGGGGGGGGYSGGGGGGGSRTGNKLLDNMNQAMLTYALAQKGIYSNQWSYSAYRPREAEGAAALGLSPAQYNRLARQYAQGGTGTASKYIQGGGSPSTAEYFKKVFGG